MLAAVALLSPVWAHAAVTSYAQDFETVVQSDPNALANDGWIVYGNVFTATRDYVYGYGPYPAPNGGAAFSAIEAGQGGTGQGTQQLSVYNDYNNADHAKGSLVEANVYREMSVAAEDAGKTWVFMFSAKKGNLTGASTALAFIKTLDPNSGWQMTHMITADMTTTPDTWQTYSISIPIDAALVGQILQFGFASTATNYDGSGVLYDNIVFGPQVIVGPTAVQPSSWGWLRAGQR
jgi:hypothetical protein